MKIPHMRNVHPFSPVPNKKRSVRRSGRGFFCGFWSTVFVHPFPVKPIPIGDARRRRGCAVTAHPSTVDPSPVVRGGVRGC